MSVEKKIEALEYILACYYDEPDNDTKRNELIRSKVEGNDHIKTYARFTETNLQEYLVALQAQLNAIVITEEKIVKLVDDRIEKKMKSSPGKHNAVFPLFKNRNMCGTSFAFDTCRVLSARHNLFAPTEVSSRNLTDTFEILCGTELVEMQIERTPEPASAGIALPDTNDWVILRRMDRINFRMTIIVMPTDDDVIISSRPYITIYHFPKDFQASINVPRNVLSSQNRLIGSNQGKLNCNDISNVSGGSCGGPYVDHTSGGAYGFHIEGVNAYNGTGYKELDESTSLVPVALHFHTGSTLVAELRRMKVLF